MENADFDRLLGFGGRGVRGNFLALMRAVRRGTPLPVRGIENKRSLVFTGNLASALIAVAETTSGGTYLISDSEFSSAGLADALGEALGRRPRLFAIPSPLLRAAATMPLIGGAVSRLTTSLLVDSDKIRSELRWSPPFTAREGFAATARWYTQSTS